MWFALRNHPMALLMPQSGRRPQHQKQTYAVHKPMSAKCQLRTSLLFPHKPFCRARGALRIAAIAVDQHQGHGAFG